MPKSKSAFKTTLFAKLDAFVKVHRSLPDRKLLILHMKSKYSLLKIETLNTYLTLYSEVSQMQWPSILDNVVRDRDIYDRFF